MSGVFDYGIGLEGRHLSVPTSDRLCMLPSLSNSVAIV